MERGVNVSNIWDCEYYNRCKNTDKCLKCGPDQRFLKLPGDTARKKAHSRIARNTVTSIVDNSGETLEDYVADKLNALPSVKEWQARRQIGSGNIWFMPGDVADPVILAECKERGTVNSKGEKTMTIPKTMLDKIEQEAKTYGSYPALPFRYKNDQSGKTYFAQDFDVLCEMVHEIKMLRKENQVLENERDVYKATSEELHKEVLRLRKKAGE